MVFDLFYTSFWIFLIFFGVRSRCVLKNNSELNKLTAYGFLIKSTATISLVFVFEKYAPALNLFIDTKAYMQDTAYLNSVFWVSPIVYLKFLTGIGETNELILTHLSDTYLWDKGQGLYNDSKNVVRFNSLIYFISRGNVYVHVVFMSFFSTIGIRLIVVAFKKHVKAYRTLFFVLLFLLPSLFVSTGGVLKEPFLILGMGLFLYGLFCREQSAAKWMSLTIGLGVLIIVKPYVLILILFSLLFFLFSKYVYPNKIWISLSFFTLISSFLFFTIKPIKMKTIEYISRKQLDMERVANGGIYVFENKENPRILYFKIEELDKIEVVNDSIRIIAPVVVGKSTLNQWEDLRLIHLDPGPEKWKIYASISSKANSFFYTTPIRNSVNTFVITMPEAFFNALLRPFPGDPGSSYKYLAMLEVVFCLGIFVLALSNRKKTTTFENRLLGSLIVFTVLMLLLIGYTTPVVGALVRYRVPAFIALIIFSFIIFKIPEKWKNQIQ